MKLELKHLAPYLPYGLTMYGASEFWLLHGIVDDFDEIEFSIYLKKNPEEYYIGSSVEFSPVLRPLSDLTKEEELKKPKGYDFIPHWMYQDLIKWHFDVFGLIEQGLAIDINTIKG